MSVIMFKKRWRMECIEKEACRINKKFKKKVEKTFDRPRQFKKREEELMMGSVPSPCREISSALEKMEAAELVCLGEKVLTESDVKRNLARLFIPTECMVMLKPYLWAEEMVEMETKPKARCGSPGILVAVVDPEGDVWELKYTYWNSLKRFVLTGRGWNELVTKNRFHEGVRVRLWAFRFSHHQRLGFAVEKA